MNEIIADLEIVVKEHVNNTFQEIFDKTMKELEKSGEKYTKYVEAKENGKTVEPDYFTLSDVENIINVSLETFKSGLSDMTEDIVKIWRKVEEDA
ncbi:MAG: hypothetical protein LBT59_24755 [Clostridiales bacterium]|nr:hypothetical protein [Clostridiales bacterium]